MRRQQPARARTECSVASLAPAVAGTWGYAFYAHDSPAAILKIGRRVCAGLDQNKCGCLDRLPLCRVPPWLSCEPDPVPQRSGFAAPTTHEFTRARPSASFPCSPRPRAAQRSPRAAGGQRGRLLWILVKHAGARLQRSRQRHTRRQPALGEPTAPAVMRATPLVAVAARRRLRAVAAHDVDHGVGRIRRRCGCQLHYPNTS